LLRTRLVAPEFIAVCPIEPDDRDHSPDLGHVGKRLPS